MPLPSQMARPTVTRRVSFRSGASRRRSRGPMRPFLALVAVLVLLIGGWMLWPRGEQPSAAEPTAVVSSSEPTGSTRRLPVANEPAEARQPEMMQSERPVRREPSPERAGADNDPTAPGPAVFTMDPPRSTPQASGMNEREPMSTVTDPVRPINTPTNAPAVRPRSEAQAILAVAQRAIDENRPLDAREELNRALHAVDFTPAERDAFRTRLSELNETLFFSPTVTPNDPLVFAYTVKSGDMLINIVRREEARVDWRFITRINNISDPSRIRVGQTLKMVRGPLHAVVDKSAFRMDLYADQTDGQGNRIYLRSFPVGLGEYDSTPLGRFAVRRNSKLINPRWVNPRTGEVFAADDAKNPIGERWIGLEGTDANTGTLQGYGIHGTIEPESIGQMASMGCIRMLSPDVELVYEALVERVSEVEIIP